MHLLIRQLRALIFLSLYAIIEILFTHKFGIQTFFWPGISVCPAPINLDIGYLNKLQLRVIYIARFLAKDQFALDAWYRSILKDMERRLEAQKARGEIPDDQLWTGVDTYLPGQLSGKDFNKKYVMTGTPVIIKGGANKMKCMQWTPDFFAKRFPDFKVNIIDLHTDHHFAGTIKDVVDSRGTDRKLYIHNSANIFSYNTDLFEELQWRDYQEHMGGSAAQFLGAQLFLGVHRGTGTTHHAANNTNLFYQLHGKKEWTFTHPDYTWVMYPFFNRFFLFVASAVRLEYDDQLIRKYFPLQKYCPHQVATLEPGDLLLNPTWRWHQINNISDESVGVASRWIVPTARTNKFFDMIQLVVPAIWRLKFDGLSTKPDEPVIIDENTRGLVKTHDDYINFGKPGSSEKYFTLHKTDAEYLKRAKARPAGVYNDAPRGL